MPGQTAENVALAILDDRRGADYYQDPKILAQFIGGTLGMSEERAESTAKAILDDRRGADYYKDPKILAEFLGG